MSLSNKRLAQLIAGPYTRLLAEHETAIADFYRVLADLLKNNRSFWLALADEEMQHKKLIEKVEEKLQNGEWRFKRPGFIVSAITDSIEWIDERGKNIAAHGTSMRDALKLALELENNMMERQFFEVVDNDTPQMISVIESLAAYSRAHARRVELEAKRLKWRILGRRRVKPSKVKKTAALSSRELRNRVKAAQADMLGLLVSLEENISNLYNAYSRRISGSSGDFWAKMAAEEMQHASMLRKMYDLLDREKVFYNVNRFNRNAIEADIGFVLRAEFEALRGKLTMHSAINTALKIEIALTESGFYSTATSDAPEFQHVAARLTELTKAHIHELNQEAGRVIETGEKAAEELPLPNTIHSG